MTDSGTGGWPTFRGGPSRSGRAVQPTASDSSATEWRFDTDGPVFSSPTVAAGTVYVGSHDDTVYAVPVSPV